MDPPPKVSRSMSNKSGSTSNSNNPNPADLDGEMEEIPSSTEPPDSKNYIQNPNSNSASIIHLQQQQQQQNGMRSTTSNSSQPSTTTTSAASQPSAQLTPQATLLSTSSVANPKKVSRSPSTKKSNVDAAKKEAAAIAASCASNSNASDSDNPKQPSSAAPTQKKLPAGPKHKWTVDETDALVEGCNKHGIGNWTAILNDEEFVGRFSNRIPGDLKDRFRTYFTDTYHELYPNAKTHHGQTPRGKDAEGKSIFAKGKARERRPFTPAEDEAIKSGFDQHGAHWATIAKDEVFQGLRRPIDLRDRFRNAFPARYAELGYKARPSKPKKDRSASSSSSHRPSVNSITSLSPAGSAAASQGTSGSAVLSDSDAPSTTNRRTTVSSTNSVSGDFSLSEASDAEHEGPAGRNNSGIGQLSLVSVGRSTSYESHMSASQPMGHDRSRSGHDPEAPPFFPPNFNLASNPQQPNFDGSRQAFPSAQAPNFSGYTDPSEPPPAPFFAPSAYDGFDFNFPTQQSNHPKSASAGMESDINRQFRTGDAASGIGGLRRSQSSKRANPKISNFEEVSSQSQSQPGSTSGSRPASIASPHSLLYPGSVPPRPGYSQSYSADTLPWQAASASAVDFAQVISRTSASELLDSPHSNEMELDESSQRRVEASIPSRPQLAQQNCSDSSIQQQQQQHRNVAPPAQAQAQSQPQAQANNYMSFMSNDFSNIGSNSPKPRSNSIHGRAWNPNPSSTGLSRIDAADLFRDRYNLESMLDPSNATPTTGGSWVWIPHSSGTASVGGNLPGLPPPPPPPPFAGPPPGYPYSHPFAGDLHINDELPSFVDLASMHLPDGTNNSGMTEQLLAQVRAQSAHSASGSSISIHSGHEGMDMDMDVEMDLGMDMQVQSVPIQTSNSHPAHERPFPSSSGGAGENERSSAPGSAFGVEDPSVGSTAPRRLSHPPRPSQDLQRSAYRSSAFAADDLALTLGSQTLFTPNQQLISHRRRRSTDNLDHGNGQSSEPGPSMDWVQGDKVDEAEKDQSRLDSSSRPPNVNERARQSIGQEFSLANHGNGSGAGPFSDPPSADLDPSYAASLPDTSMQTDALSNSGLQQFSYDDIDLPSFLNRSPVRQAVDSHPLLSPRQQPLNFDFSTGWATNVNNSFLNGSGRAMSVTHQQDNGSPDVRFLGNHPKAWSDYGVIEGGENRETSVFPFGTAHLSGAGSIRPESQSSRASSSINGWDGGSEGGGAGHASSSRDPSQGGLEEFFSEQDLVARSRTPKTTGNGNGNGGNSRESSSQRSGY